MLNASVIKGLKTALFTTAVFAASHASADIVISGTRIVYPESSKDVIVNLDNRGENLCWFNPGWTTVVTKQTQKNLSYRS